MDRWMDGVGFLVTCEVLASAVVTWIIVVGYSHASVSFDVDVRYNCQV